MGSFSKISISIILILTGIWLLIPTGPIIKPTGPLMESLVWWPNLLILIKGIIPIGTFLFGSLLLWIEFDEWRSSHSTGKVEDFEEDDMPAFEDVEYKDLECPECGEDFKTDIGLKVHRKVNHPDEFEENPEPYGD